MTTSTQVKGMASHINQIWAKWEGIDMTLIKYDVDLDDNGKVVGKTPSSTTIKGVISSVPFAEEEAAGRAEDNQLKGVFLWSGTTPEIDDEVVDTTHGNKKYVVVDIPYVDRDIDNPVLITTVLREIPYGA